MKSTQHAHRQSRNDWRSRTRRVYRPIKNVIGAGISFIARAAHIDLVILGYQNMGIMRYWNDDVSGETFARTRVLNSLGSVANPVVLDVGANRGDFTRSVLQESTTCSVTAFEPNPSLLGILRGIPESRLIVVPCAVGATHGSVTLHNYCDALGSEMSAHGSIYPDVLSTVHSASEITSVQVEMISLDDYLADRDIGDVHYLKIDTEGNELEVLRGARKLIGSDAFWFIQFEFNEMNVFSRSFLRDFYEVLPNYDFFRLAEDRLIPLGVYSSTNEIFRYQNLLAVNRLKVHNFSPD